MKTRWIALALLAAAIVVIAVFFSLHDTHRDHPEAVPLTTLAPAAVTRLVVKKQGNVVLDLRRRANGWGMLAPQKARADSQQVRVLLAALNEPTARHYSASSLKLSNVGLDPPDFTLVANGVRLAFGTLNPANLLRYIRRGDTVYLVMDRIAPLIARGPGYFAASRPAQTAAHAGTAGS
ncbi:MAG: DUF4340 domain-containing protein [Gammaproteobacteria bacterium]